MDYYLIVQYWIGLCEWVIVQWIIVKVAKDIVQRIVLLE